MAQWTDILVEILAREEFCMVPPKLNESNKTTYNYNFKHSPLPTQVPSQFSLRNFLRVYLPLYPASLPNTNTLNTLEQPITFHWSLQLAHSLIIHHLRAFSNHLYDSKRNHSKQKNIQKLSLLIEIQYKPIKHCKFCHPTAPYDRRVIMICRWSLIWYQEKPYLPNKTLRNSSSWSAKGPFMNCLWLIYTYINRKSYTVQTIYWKISFLHYKNSPHCTKVLDPVFTRNPSDHP